MRIVKALILAGLVLSMACLALGGGVMAADGQKYYVRKGAKEEKENKERSAVTAAPRAPASSGANTPATGVNAAEQAQALQLYEQINQPCSKKDMKRLEEINGSISYTPVDDGKRDGEYEGGFDKAEKYFTEPGFTEEFVTLNLRCKNGVTAAKK